MPGVFEIMLVGILCFNLGNSLGYKRHSNEHHRKPDKQIVINDSTKVVNIYVDGYGQYWSDSRFTMRWDPYWRFGFYGPRIVVFHKGGKKYKKWVHPKRRGHHKKRFRG